MQAPDSLAWEERDETRVATVEIEGEVYRVIDDERLGARLTVARLSDLRVEAITWKAVVGGQLSDPSTEEGLADAIRTLFLGAPVPPPPARSPGGSVAAGKRAKQVGADLGLDPKLVALLVVLAEVDDEILENVYAIRGEDRAAPLDGALYAWREAGCPIERKRKGRRK